VTTDSSLCYRDQCDINAVCTMKHDQYACVCNPGYRGNDIDECGENVHACSPNATCTNTVGSFSCSCQSGFHG
ncbi:predicted protein, partial [Nematostella vectensis]